MAAATRRHLGFTAVEALAAEARVTTLEADAPPRLQAQLAGIGEAISSSSSRVQAPPRYTVALMGRTQAGKSTLMAALTGAPEEAIGWPGRQRHTRDVTAREMLDLPSVELIDTPGVGALDAPEDRALALEQLDRAQVVVWVAPNDGFQEDTAEALRLVAALGKPVVVVLNSKADLRREINLLEFVDDPERMLAASEGHLEAIRRHLRQAGAEPLAEVVVHAQAAFFGRQPSEHAPRLDDRQRAALETGSNIAELLDALGREVRSEPRKVLAVAHQGRFTSSAVAGELLTGAGSLLDIADRSAEKHAEVGKRHARVVEDAEARMLAAIRREVSARRSWTEGLTLQQVRKHADALWREQQELLNERVDAALQEETRRLQAELDQVLQDVDEEFSRFEHDSFEPPRMHEPWIRRTVKLGGRVATGLVGMALGAKAGAAVGGGGGAVVVPGVGAVPGAVVGGFVGGAVGLVAGLLGDPVVDRVGNLFRSETEVLSRARSRLRKQADRVLNERQQQLEQSVGRYMVKVRDDLSRQQTANDNRVDRLRQAAVALQESAARIEAATVAFDADTAASLLEAVGRPIDRSNIIDAYRYPGHGVAIRVREPAFSSLALNPARTPEPVIPVSPSKASPAADVAQVLIGLTGSAFQVADRDGGVRAALEDTLNSQGQREAWEEMAGRIIHAGVSIDAEETSSEWTGRRGDGHDDDQTLAA